MKKTVKEELDLRGLNIDMDSLVAAQQYTKNIPQGYVQISYDMRDGEVLYDYHYNTDSFTKYHSNDILTVLGTKRVVSKQEIIDSIFMEVNWRKEAEKQYGGGEDEE